MNFRCPALLIGIAALALSICQESPGFGQERLAVTGITQSISDVLLSVSVAGRIAKINYKEGDRVEQGISILNLDKEDAVTCPQSLYHFQS